MSIGDSNFNLMLGSLERNSDKTRSAIYFFVIFFSVSVAFVLSAFMDDIPRARVQAITQKAHNLLLSDAKFACDQYSDALYFDPVFEKDGNFLTTIPCSTSKNLTDDQVKFLNSIRFNLLSHAISTLTDERLRKEGTFTVPILGVSFDRTDFWLLNIALGIFGYVIVCSLLNSEIEKLSYLSDNSWDNEFRLHMILSTQVLSDRGDAQFSPLSGGKNKKSILHSIDKIRPIRIIFLAPILVSIYLLLDDLYVTDSFLEMEANIRDLILGRPTQFNIILDKIYNAPFGITSDFLYGPIRSAFSILGGLAALWFEVIWFGRLRRVMALLGLHNRKIRNRIKYLGTREVSYIQTDSII